MKQGIKWIMLGVIMVILLGVVIFRPDIDLAMKVIEHAREYPEGDWRVELAKNYLIIFEHPKTYDQLYDYLVNCTWIEASGDPPDYRQMAAVEILGEYQSPKIIDKMTEIVMRDYSPEPFIPCNPYAVEVLGMKGDEEYELIKRMAVDEIPHLSWRIRVFAIVQLGESKRPEYLGILVDLGTMDNDPFVRHFAVLGLWENGSDEALAVVREIAQSDESEMVRKTALEVLEGDVP